MSQRQADELTIACARTLASTASMRQSLTTSFTTFSSAVPRITDLDTYPHGFLTIPEFAEYLTEATERSGSNWRRRADGLSVRRPMAHPKDRREGVHRA